MQFDSSKIEGEIGSLAKADGSAKFSINETIQMCAVYGPGEVKIAKELAERSFVNVIYKPRIGVSTNREKELEYTLKSIIDGVILTNMHPRTAINIIFQEIQNDSNHLACALNCACLALLDASIPMKYTFAAVNCAILNNESRIIYFPNSKQEKDIVFSATFVFDSCEKELVSIHTTGIFDTDQLNNLLHNAKQFALEKIFPMYSNLIKNNYFKEAK